MGDFEFGAVETVGPRERQLPFEDPELRHSIKLKGEKPEDGLLVFVRKRVLKDIVDYSRTQLTREIGGVLVGEYYRDRGRDFIMVEAYVKAEKAVSHAASLTFTHEALHEVNNLMTEKYEGKVQVGWHHTHPNYGVFLSSYDLFIHRSYFNLPWQVAMVVDPCRETLGFLRWRNGRMETTGFYYFESEGA